MNEQVASILSNRWTIPVAAGVVGVAGGFAAGYIYGRKKGVSDFLDLVETGVKYEDNREPLKVNPDQLVFEPIDGEAYEAARFIVDEEGYSGATEGFEEVEELPDEPTNSVKDYTDYSSGLRTSSEEKTEDVPESQQDQHILQVDPLPQPLITTNIFHRETDDWDYEEELKHRTPENPYVIHVDEYAANENDYAQETLTYYVGDDILTDQENAPIMDYTRIIGELNFGHGSGDPNLVYIQSDRLKLAWEIIRHTGRFDVEVLGAQIEYDYEDQDMRHSQPRRFKQE